MKRRTYGINVEYENVEMKFTQLYTVQCTYSMYCTVYTIQLQLIPIGLCLR